MALGKKTAGKTAAAPSTPAAPAPMTLDKIGSGIKKIIGELAELKEAQTVTNEAIAALATQLEELAAGAGAEEEGAEEEGAGAEITEDDIRRMKKPELLQLITDYDLDIDVDAVTKLGDLRQAIIDLMGGDDSGEEGAEEGTEDSSGEDW